MLRRLDLWLLDWIKRTWDKGDKTVLSQVADLKPPFKGLLEKSILLAMLEIWREGRDQSAQVLQRLRRKEYAKRKRALLASVRELVDEDSGYDEVVVLYLAIAADLGTELWNAKVEATERMVTTAREEGWGLFDEKVYVTTAGKKVSAFEATGGTAGVKSGYTQVIQTPGIISRLRPELAVSSGWQLDRIVRTETTRAYNHGMLHGYSEDDAIAGFEFVAVVDSRTTDRCLMLDGTIINKDDPRLYELTPPLHVNCRSQLSPVFVFDKRIAATLDEEVTRRLEDRHGKVYSLTYDPGRMMPMAKEGKLTKAGFGRENLMTKAESEVRRQGFIPPTPDKMRRDFLGIKEE